jgi:hypothetical protein
MIVKEAGKPSGEIAEIGELFLMRVHFTEAESTQVMPVNSP